MANSDRDEDNPYASPKGIVEGPAHEEPKEDVDEFVIEPWIGFRGLLDFLCSYLVILEWVAVMGVVFAATCITACWWWGGPEPEGVLVGLGVGVVLFLPVGILEILCKLKHLRIDAAGIAFGRRLGKPKFLAWEEIRGIRPGTRWEVLIHAWMRLWLDPVKSQSTAGHYRIEWTGGYVYFPPKDPVVFEKAVRKFCPRLLGDA